MYMYRIEGNFPAIRYIEAPTCWSLSFVASSVSRCDILTSDKLVITFFEIPLEKEHLVISVSFLVNTLVYHPAPIWNGEGGDVHFLLMCLSIVFCLPDCWGTCSVHDLACNVIVADHHEGSCIGGAQPSQVVDFKFASSRAHFPHSCYHPAHVHGSVRQQ